MCDYSLHSVTSRPARAGDNLVTGSFPTTTTRGFAAVDGPGIAVCLLPGTELAFEKDVEWGRSFVRFFQRKQATGNLVRFRQINLDKPNAHHDAVEFPNGRVVLLTDLCKGQRAKVLQLPVAAQIAQPERLSERHADGPVIDLAPARPGLSDRSEWFFVW